MTAIPHIVVQLVHIEGPQKGMIQELSDTEIFIGRHPDCQVQFPKDMVALSRKHARIVREGNRFKIIDQSTNGTFVNGKQLPEAYLKDGDVLTFAEGGPKVSFLTQVSDQPTPPFVSTPIPSPGDPPQMRPAPVDRPPGSQPPAAPQPIASQPAAVSPAGGGPLVQSVKRPFAIQYGPALKSFQTLPIVLGKSSRCDFVIDHPAMHAQQAQFFFAEDRYWVKDLTGTGSVLIDGVPVPTQAPLEPNMQVALSAQGPRFRFLGGGRLAEIDDPMPVKSPSEPSDGPPPQADAKISPDSPKPAGSLFKKFFR